MKTPMRLLPFAGLACLALSAAPLRAAPREVVTLESSAEVLEALTAVPLKGIPLSLLCDAKGIAIIPGVIKAGFVVGGRHGHGVVLVREPNGAWGNPVFVSLTGGSIGWQVGVQSTDVVLVFKTGHSLDRILKGKGKLTLGADVAVAAGPVGRQAEAGTDGQLRAEIYSYSRSRGLFAGLSVEGAGLLVDADANQAFYGTADVGPGKAVTVPSLQAATAVNKLKSQMSALTAPPPPPVILQPVAPPPSYPAPRVVPAPPPPVPPAPLPR